MVELVNTVRGPHASGNPAKVYFQYMRPFRWSSDVSIVPALKPAYHQSPWRTAASQAATQTQAIWHPFLWPMQFRNSLKNVLPNASEIGNYRIIAGMHSPMDVMGGRTMAMALAAAA